MSRERGVAYVEREPNGETSGERASDVGRMDIRARMWFIRRNRALSAG
jgi:hypothetical protein